MVLTVDFEEKTCLVIGEVASFVYCCGLVLGGHDLLEDVEIAVLNINCTKLDQFIFVFFRYALVGSKKLAARFYWFIRPFFRFIDSVIASPLWTVFYSFGLSSRQESLFFYLGKIKGCLNSYSGRAWLSQNLPVLEGFLLADRVQADFFLTQNLLLLHFYLHPLIMFLGLLVSCAYYWRLTKLLQFFVDSVVLKLQYGVKKLLHNTRETIKCDDFF